MLRVVGYISMPFSFSAALAGDPAPQAVPNIERKWADCKNQPIF